MKKPDPKEKICYNCKHIAWLIGVGQGLRCSNSKKEKKLDIVPSKFHSCELFELKNTN